MSEASTEQKRAPRSPSWAARLARLSRQAAALGILVLSVRLSYSVGASAFEHFDQAPSARGSERKGGAAASNSASGVPSAEAPVGGVLPIPGGNSHHRRVGTVHPRRLVVDVGIDRSEVFVDGRSVGHVPYVGEWACASGVDLEITLVPPAGAPTDYRVPCRGEDINVRAEHQILAPE